jgi:hypothetical protein
MLDSVLGLSAEPIIVGLIIALILALPILGVFAAFRRRGKDPAMALVGLAVVANLLGMIVASGYVRSTSTSGITPDSNRPPMRRGVGPPPRGFRGPEQQDRPEVSQSENLASRIMLDADVDRDGLLSAGEAAAAASAFVKSASVEDRESIDKATLRELLRLWLRHSQDAPGSPFDGFRSEAPQAEDRRSPTITP